MKIELEAYQSLVQTPNATLCYVLREMYGVGLACGILNDVFPAFADHLFAHLYRMYGNINKTNLPAQRDIRTKQIMNANLLSVGKILTILI